MRILKIKSGFSLAEILIVIAIVIVISLIILSNFYSHRGFSELKSTTLQIVSLLDEARNRSINQDKYSNWGVYFKNSTSTPPFYTLFYASDSVSTTIKRYNLSQYVEFNSSSIPVGGELSINFSKIKGIPSTTTIIYLNLKSRNQINTTSSITINLNGLIDYNISR